MESKTFVDLEFKHGGAQAEIAFANGYGVSVIPQRRGGIGGVVVPGYYELMVLDADGRACYDTPITTDVLSYRSPREITEIMDRVQELPERTAVDEVEELDTTCPVCGERFVGCMNLHPTLVGAACPRCGEFHSWVPAEFGADVY